MEYAISRAEQGPGPPEHAPLLARFLPLCPRYQRLRPTIFFILSLCAQCALWLSSSCPCAQGISGCLDLCESAQSAIPFRFTQLNISLCLIYLRFFFVSWCLRGVFLFSRQFVVHSFLRGLVSSWRAVNYAKQSQFQNRQNSSNPLLWKAL